MSDLSDALETLEEFALETANEAAFYPLEVRITRLIDTSTFTTRVRFGKFETAHLTDARGASNILANEHNKSGTAFFPPGFTLEPGDECEIIAGQHTGARYFLTDPMKDRTTGVTATIRPRLVDDTLEVFAPGVQTVDAVLGPRTAPGASVHSAPCNLQRTKRESLTPREVGGQVFGIPDAIILTRSDASLFVTDARFKVNGVEWYLMEAPRPVAGQPLHVELLVTTRRLTRAG